MATPVMTVLHLDTGHVLAAGAFPGATPTVETLTGGSHLALRVPASSILAVPSPLLTLLQVPWDGHVIAAPVHFRVVETEPRLSWVAAPSQSGGVMGTPWQACLTFWDAGGHVEVVRDQLDGTGALTSTGPPLSALRLVAVAGRPLRYGP